MALYTCDCKEIAKKYESKNNAVTSTFQASDQLEKCQKCYDKEIHTEALVKAYDNVRLKYVELYWKRRVTQKDLI